MYKTAVFKIIILLILIVYAGIVIKLILFKKPHRAVTSHRVHGNFRKANFKPFHTISFYLSGKPRDPLKNIIGNIILFIPLTILIPLLFEKTQRGSKIILIFLLTSLAFEIIQLFTLFGSFDVDDLILNTLGGFIGFFIFIIIENWYGSSKVILQH